MLTDADRNLHFVSFFCGFTNVKTESRAFFFSPPSSSSHILCFSVWVRVQCGGCWQNALCKMSETSIWGRAVDLDAGKGGERKHQVLSSQGRFEMRICSDHLLDRPSLTGAEGFFFFF